MRYIDEEPTSEPDLLQIEALALISRCLSVLAAWLANLAQAAIDGDVGLVLTLMARIRKQNSFLA